MTRAKAVRSGLLPSAGKGVSRIAGIFPIMVLMILIVPLYAQSQYSTWTREQLGAGFDEVARNYGATEYAIYTFMVEFGRAPQSLDELRETGHLNVIMTNPYTGGEVESLTVEDYPDGDLIGNILVSNKLNNGREARVETWFLRPQGRHTLISRSMVKRIALYESEIDHGYFFENDLPRDEQFTAIYCSQAMDALESFAQKKGRSPDDFEDMYDNGDVNVHYVNPVTGELAVSSEELSPGDFCYRKIGDDGYTMIGWGRERPVFFATTDADEEMNFYAQWPELVPKE